MRVMLPHSMILFLLLGVGVGVGVVHGFSTSFAIKRTKTIIHHHHQQHATSFHQDGLSSSSTCNNESCEHDTTLPEYYDRRLFINHVSRVMTAAAAATSLPLPSYALDNDNGIVITTTTTPKELLKGTVRVQPGADPVNEPNTALYITARPDRPDNVPAAILNGSRGKPPPVLSARFANPSFPFEFTLSADNLTEEGASVVVVEGVSDKTEQEKLWWSGDNLIVSARLDSDGVASTRDPADLVGRGYSKINSSGGGDGVEVQLQGRGIGGKFVTSKAKK